MHCDRLNGDTINYKLCIQLSDTHLFADSSQKLLGINTQHSLNAVIQRIKEAWSSIDLLVVTGDISQDQSLASYQRFKQMIASLKAPSLWTSGNHDQLTLVKDMEEFKAHVLFQYDLGDHWRVIMLNSQVIGEPYGQLSLEQLDQLCVSLQSTERFHLICLHHPPFASSARWLNDISLREPWYLLDRLECHLNANVVLCGHIHQVVEYYYRGLFLLSCPSTCIQFAPNSRHFKLDHLAPGYRWLKLYDDGRIETDVVRLKEMEYTLDTSARYY